MQQIIITSELAGQRLNKLLGKYLDEAPQSFIYKMLRKKNIKLNDKKATGNEIVKEFDVVTLYLTDSTIDTFQKKQIQTAVSSASNSLPSLQILYEDKDILIVNKAVGVLSQKARADDYSINEQIVDYWRGKYQDNSMFVPSVCNRLDRNTSGILLAGMSLSGSQLLSKMLKQRRVDKYYLTIVSGIVEKDRTIQGFLTKKKNHNQVVIYKTLEEAQRAAADKPAYIETRYEPLDYGRFDGDDVTLLQVKLITGKTHQIRAHLHAAGHPILGDGKYGNKPINDRLRKEFGLKHQLLHAYVLCFPPREVEPELPETLVGKKITADLPEEFSKIKDALFPKNTKRHDTRRE